LSALCKNDFHAWALKSAELVRQRQFDQLNLAVEDGGLPGIVFPTECPYTMGKIIDKQFYPIARNDI